MQELQQRIRRLKKYTIKPTVKLQKKPASAKKEDPLGKLP